METKLDMLIHQQDSEESEMLETEIKTEKERKLEMTHEEMIGKVVEVKKPFSVYYSVYYYAPFSGGNEIVAKPGTRFKIKGVWGEDAYECSAEDREFEKEAEKAELKKVKPFPFIRMKFGHIDGFKLPVALLEDGTVEILSAAEIDKPQDGVEEETENEEAEGAF